MTAKNETLDAVLDELKRHGITSAVSHGSKHIQVQWFNRLGEPRFMTVSRRDSGEWHQQRNARHQVRQKLRDDGMLPEDENVILPTRSLSRVDHLELELRQLNIRIAKVEQILKEQTT